jgi:hypothetical protein
MIVASLRDGNTWSTFQGSEHRTTIEWPMNNWTIFFKELTVNQKQSIWMEYFSEQRKRAESSRNAKYTINAQHTIYVNHPTKTLNGNFAASQGGLSVLIQLRSDGFWYNKTGGWTSWDASKGT